MPRLTKIREALRAALPEDSEEFMAEVFTGKQAEQETFKGRMGPPQMIVRVYVGEPADKDAQARLDALLDDEEECSITALIHADKKLGGLVNGLRVIATSGWRTYPTKDAPVLGAEWIVQTR